MHAQAIDGSRQMQQTVVRQYVCMVHSFCEEGPFINYMGNIRSGGQKLSQKFVNGKGASINDVGTFFQLF